MGAFSQTRSVERSLDKISRFFIYRLRYFFATAPGKKEIRAFFTNCLRVIATFFA
jgi:hypothetical protein